VGGFVFFVEEGGNRLSEKRRGRRGDAKLRSRRISILISPKKLSNHLRFDQRPRRRGRRQHRKEHEGREGRGEEDPRGREGGGLAGHLFFLFSRVFLGRRKRVAASVSEILALVLPEVN